MGESAESFKVDQFLIIRVAEANYARQITQITNPTCTVPKGMVAVGKRLQHDAAGSVV